MYSKFDIFINCDAIKVSWQCGPAYILRPVYNMGGGGGGSKSALWFLIPFANGHPIEVGTSPSATSRLTRLWIMPRPKKFGGKLDSPCPSVRLWATRFPEPRNFKFKFHVHVGCGQRQKHIDFQWRQFENGRLAAILIFFVCFRVLASVWHWISDPNFSCALPVYG